MTTKIVREVEEILLRANPLEVEQVKQLNVKLQQLDGKLKILSDIDKEILDKCEEDCFRVCSICLGSVPTK